MDMKNISIENLISPSSLAELRKIELRSRRTVTTAMAGSYRSAFRGSGLVFSDIREYMPGDDVKNIHWKVTARSGTVYIKSYEEDRELNIVIALDISNSTAAGSNKSKYQKGLEFSALICMLAKLSQDSLGLCLFSDKTEEFLPVSRSRSQYKRIILELLNSRELNAATNLPAALEYLNKNLRKTSVIFFISDFFGSDYSHELKMLSMKHDVIAVMLEDQLDHTLPDAGLVEFIDAESGEFALIDCSNRNIRKQLKETHEKRIHDWVEICKKANCDFLDLRDNPLRNLNQLMQRRNLRLR